MSSKLLQYFLQDDVESFQRFLANASYASGGQRAAAGNTTPKVGSPGAPLGSSPNPSKNKKTTGTSPGMSFPDRGGVQRPSTTLSRAQVNARDQYGRTLLHLVASSPKASAIEFATALLEIPFIDIYAQDSESGWTALHRALYSGNAAIAQALMARDMRDATNFSTPGGVHHPSGGLIKIKDREGYSPFDVYGATIMSRDIKQVVPRDVDLAVHGTAVTEPGDGDASSSSHSAYGDDNDEDKNAARAILKPRTNLQADEVFTFGSNKNLTLGLGDEDDRQFPERIAVERPEHLLRRFYREYEERRSNHDGRDMSTSQHNISRPSDLPILIRSKPISFQDIVMSKLHTAILTNDPESNLFMSGFGPGGRLGTGDESTRFSFVCIETGALAGKKIVSVALGQDHSLAISENGEIFSWGSNKYGQLGYNLPRTNNKNDVPIQTTPRQIFNPFKREIILGAAASAIHSVVFSTSGLYTFGKNEGQLGLVDSDARSLEIQVTPRRVGVSLFNSPIQMVSAIDRATTVLLESHDVWVFTQYGYSKLSFPLDVSSSFIRNSFLATRYATSVNRIVKVTSGGDTICAMSSFGEVYTVQVNQKADTSSASSSTTNPAKIRNSLSQPVRAWSVRKSHMAVKDVDVGQDGSIIICTNSGSAWRKEKRAKIKAGGSKDYKFVRIPGLSRVVGVRSNAFGAYAVAQRDCDVTKEQIHVDESTLWNDFSHLLPFQGLNAAGDETGLDESAEDSLASFGLIPKIKRAVLSSPDIESQIQPVLQAHELFSNPRGTVWITSTVSDVRIPVHEFVLTGRSPVLRKAFPQFRQDYFFSIPDVATIEYGKDGQVEVRFQGVDFLSILNLVFFVYTDSVLDVWRGIKSTSENAFRYRQVRTEVMRIATHLRLRHLERAARIMIEPTKCLNIDMDHAINDPSFFESGDVTIQLNGGTVKAHSQIMCQRCPFFEGLFHGRSGGKWLSSRRDNLVEDTISVDLKDIDLTVFDFVLRHVYADTEEELFDDVRSENLDDFIDLVLDVMSAANELMMDRLAQICQKMLGRFVNTRNVCHLLNAVAPCSVTEFKDAALEYICLNLEVMLENRFLDDLDEDLLGELDEVCQENQLACYPVSRARNSEDFAFEKYPELVSLVEHDRQRRIDSMKLRSRLQQDEAQEEKFRAGNADKIPASPLSRKAKPSPTKEINPTADCPALKSKQSTGELMFQMDDEGALSPDPSQKGKGTVRAVSFGSRSGDRQFLEPPSPTVQTTFVQGDSLGERGDLDERMGSTSDTILAESPSEMRAKTVQETKPSSPLPEKVGSKAPWSSTVISSSKKDLKEIMAEASQSRVSNLTLGMSARREASTGGSFAPKLSQKERKKLQQQQMQEKLAAQQNAKAKPQSPWQIPTPQKLLAKPEPSASNDSQQVQSPDPMKATQRPAMTLRQTVAGAPPAQNKPGPTPSQTQSLSVSAPLMTPPRPARPVQTTPGPVPSPNFSTPSRPLIQSIRHSPRPEPSRSSFNSPSSGPLPLASILLEQQTEKDELREAATAKHSLQDIQLEQEFQEWWDKESKRVMELAKAEEAAAAAAAAAAKDGKGGGRSGRSKGSSSGRRKGGGRGKGPGGPAPAADGSSGEAAQQQKQQPAGQSPAPGGSSSEKKKHVRNANQPRNHHHHKDGGGGSSTNAHNRGRREGGTAQGKGKERAQQA
ncbi:hypothetical protein VTN00DRAFT_5012 [Thermoascus crustaceus]|uniref:uncharacterized protein n=1 Tax=Thermoascus crustaceus TaxID=5088 RepID=UPI003744A5AA